MPNKWAQFSDEELYALFARKEGIEVNNLHQFRREQIEAMLTHRKVKP